ncbi:class I SAM-dependent methyltransferase [Bacillus weihaiensis]|uniref:Methyltransferase type 11 n=1 Tax=Bacillus weihaiensis TaxID=1547283 RepID=A0A1L3MRR0_9BACI|nr:class I SAM-dependent methyltransferase [Bacillus weihaiensis]APH05025.1 methyltransferase type 11 [Bacillus weihaiensis]
MISSRRQGKWDATLYDEKHAFISEFGNQLIELLAPKKGEKILDLGCGTGDLAHTLSEQQVNVVGVDQSKSMISKAQIKYPHIPFIVKDALKLEDKNEFDAVFSNATLHWIKAPELALDRIYCSLKQGGRFVAEFGGKGNVRIITDEVIRQIERLGVDFNDNHYPWYFPSIGEYTTIMEKVGFRVTYAEHFDRFTALENENGLRNWLKMFGSSLFHGINEDEKELIVAEVEKKLRPILYKNGKWFADYKRIRVIGLKE